MQAGFACGVIYRISVIKRRLFVSNQQIHINPIDKVGIIMYS